DVPRELRQLMGKVPGARKPEEQKQLDDYKQQGIREIARGSVPQSVIYSVAFSPDGDMVAAGGSDGMVRLFSATNATAIKEFVSVPLAKATVAQAKPTWGTALTKGAEPALSEEKLPEGAKVSGLEVQPAKIKFTSPNDYAQLLVTARMGAGETADVTRLVTFSMSKAQIGEVSRHGVLRPLKDGSGKLTVSFAGNTVEVPVEISGMGQGYRADFVRDVSPVISRLGCNAGTCHGAKEGKNGFKLSL